MLQQHCVPTDFFRLDSPPSFGRELRPLLSFGFDAPQANCEEMAILHLAAQRIQTSPVKKPSLRASPHQVNEGYTTRSVTVLLRTCQASCDFLAGGVAERFLVGPQAPCRSPDDPAEQPSPPSC